MGFTRVVSPFFLIVDFDNPISVTGDPWPTYHPQDQETDSLVTSGPPNLTIRTDSVDAGDTAERSPESSAEGGFELRRSYASCALGEGKKKVVVFSCFFSRWKKCWFKLGVAFCYDFLVCLSLLVDDSVSFFFVGGTSTMDITGISKSKAGLGLQFEVASKDRLQVGQRFFMRPKRSWWFLFVLLCVFVVFICFFSRKDGFGEMTIRNTVLYFKKEIYIYIYTNFKGCQVDGKGCH